MQSSLNDYFVLPNYSLASTRFSHNGLKLSRGRHGGLWTPYSECGCSLPTGSGNVGVRMGPDRFFSTVVPISSSCLWTTCNLKALPKESLPSVVDLQSHIYTLITSQCSGLWLPWGPHGLLLGQPESQHWSNLLTMSFQAGRRGSLSPRAQSLIVLDVIKWEPPFSERKCSLLCVAYFKTPECSRIMC